MSLSEMARRALRSNQLLPPRGVPRYVEHPGPVAPDVVYAAHELASTLLSASVAVEAALDQAGADRRHELGVVDVGVLVAHVRLLAERLGPLLLRLEAVPGLDAGQAERVRSAREAMRTAAGSLAGLGGELAPGYPFPPVVGEE